MKDLYENSEISFALFWVALYVATSIILGNLGDNKTALAVGLAVISVLMFLFVYRNDLLKKYGLDGWGENNRALLWFIPLWIIASGNFWGGFLPDCHGSAIITAAVSMVFVGFVEELVFRGFLFKAMLKDGNVAMAIIVSSVTFGLGHIFSLFTGDSFIESLTGIVIAITRGFVLTMVFFKCGSLIPCIIAHCVFFCSFSIRQYSDECRSGSSSEVLTAKGKLKRVLSDYHLSYARLDRASLYPYCERGPFYVFPGL